jgi:LPXTG-motif cell wall-anchored protein
MKSTRSLTAALLLAGGAVLFSAAPAHAAINPVAPPEGAPTDKCAELDSGKEDTEGDPDSVLLEAPEGYVITMYCVKAGSDNQEVGGPLYFEVVPPVASLEVSYPEIDSVSHFSFSYEKVTTTPPSTPPVTTPPVTTPPETTHTTPPVETTPGGGDGEGEELAETGFDNGWLLFAGLGAIALGGAIAAPRIAAAKRR